MKLKEQATTERVGRGGLQKKTAAHPLKTKRVGRGGFQQKTVAHPSKTVWVRRGGLQQKTAAHPLAPSRAPRLHCRERESGSAAAKRRRLDDGVGNDALLPQAQRMCESNARTRVVAAGVGSHRPCKRQQRREATAETPSRLTLGGHNGAGRQAGLTVATVATSFASAPLSAEAATAST